MIASLARARRPCHKMAFLGFIVLAAVWLPLFTTYAQADPPSAQQIEDAITQLGDPSPSVREQAARLLHDAGSAADAALHSAAQGDDPEIAARAREILRGAPAPKAIAPAPEPEAVEQYRKAGPAMREHILSELPGQREFIALARIWGLESDAKLRAAAFQELIKSPAESAGAFLADGNVATAELVLDAAVEAHVPDAAQNYAAYFLCRGKIDQALARWAAQGNKQPPDPWAQAMLAALWRAKGDAEAARKSAEAADDSELLADALLSAGDWPRLADEMRGQAKNARFARDLTPLAACDHFAGDQQAFADDIARITKLARSTSDTHLAVNTLLIAERPDDAMKLMTDAGLLGPAFEVLIARGRYDEADALLAAHDAEGGDEAAWMRCSAARAYAMLGDKKKCAALLARVEKDNEQVKQSRVYTFLADAERGAGMQEKAWDHYFEALWELPRRTDRRWFASRAFPSDDRDIDWPDAWRIMAELSVRPRRSDFDKLRKAYDRTLPLNDLLKLADTVDLSSDDVQGWSGVIWEAGRKLREAGRPEHADALLEKSAQAAKSGDLYVRMGDVAADGKEWSRAADFYGRGWQKDRAKALPLYLQGWALQRAGRVAEGRECTELAHVLPVGDDSHRQELMRGLALRGLDEAAAREADVLIRTGGSFGPSAEAALGIAAEHALKHGDFAAAVGLMQRMLLHFTTGSLWLREQYSYLYLPTGIRRAHARALLAAGDLPGARHEIDACLEQMPDEIIVAIDLVPDLEKRGYREEADALYSRTLARQQALCDRFPDSANHHNQLAWLAAECRRDLDKALEHAKRAVELEPNHAAYIDTLGETYFQRGEIEKAV
ncbi:MAG: hypothetical protein JWL69_3565, partial [Phycisphaerales bacterium]|nr:hypothetical protein [Phycisphaerales bacterium]